MNQPAINLEPTLESLILEKRLLYQRLNQAQPGSADYNDLCRKIVELTSRINQLNLPKF